MKDFETMTEYQLLNLARQALYERIAHEEEINKITKKKYGRYSRICQSRLKMYNEQLKEVREKIIEIKKEN